MKVGNKKYIFIAIHCYWVLFNDSLVHYSVWIMNKEMAPFSLFKSNNKGSGIFQIKNTNKWTKEANKSMKSI